MRLIHALLLPVLLLAPFQPSAAQTPEGEPSLSRILSAPFPLSLSASETGGRIAWVSNEAGVRNILVGEGEAGKPLAVRQLTSHTADDGFELDHLRWTADGGALVYTGGGSLEGGGPVNPQSLASGPIAKRVYMLALGGKGPRNLGLGEQPSPAPHGTAVAFLRSGQIWLARSDSAAPAAQLFSVRGSITDFRWSPDATRIAFIDSRPEGHSLLGIYDLADGAVRWIGASADMDAAPAWSPDSSQVAWLRLPAPKVTDFGFSPKKAGAPWSIWVADAASGRVGPIWRAQPGDGSIFHPVEDGTSLLWTPGGRLVFPWEATGWIRLYSIAPDGGAPAALTPDGAEVFAAALDRASGRIVFSSNSGDADHRHIWSVPDRGGAARPLTDGASINDLPSIDGAGRLFVLRSTARLPLHVATLDQKGRATAVAEAGANPYPAEKLVAPEPVIFQSPDGLAVHGQVFARPAPAGKRRPAVIFFHGGPQRQMLLGWHPMGAYSHLYAMNQHLALGDYVVLSVNFRGGTGYGLHFREADKFAEAGGSEVNDIAGAIAYLKGRADVDPDRLGVYGMSYGGVMTAMALGHFPDSFKAGVDIAGVHNWTSFLPYLSMPSTPQAVKDIAYQSSPIAKVANWRAPVLLIHGDNDRAVPFAQSIELIQGLRAAGRVEPDQLVFPDEVHDFIRHATWLSAFEATRRYLDVHLAPAER